MEALAGQLLLAPVLALVLVENLPPHPSMASPHQAILPLERWTGRIDRLGGDQEWNLRKACHVAPKGESHMLPRWSPVVVHVPSKDQTNLES